MIRHILSEFKKFAMRGNVLDMAVGVIIGAAFGKIVDSLVKDLIMPPIGILLGEIDFKNLFIVLKEGSKPGPYETLIQAQDAGAVTMNMGNFINAVISFLIVAFAVFILIKAVNTLRAKLDAQEKKEEKAATPTTKLCPYCATTIPLAAIRCPYCTTLLNEQSTTHRPKGK